MNWVSQSIALVMGDICCCVFVFLVSTVIILLQVVESKEAELLATLSHSHSLNIIHDKTATEFPKSSQ